MGGEEASSLACVGLGSGWGEAGERGGWGSVVVDRMGRRKPNQEEQVGVRVSMLTGAWRRQTVDLIISRPQERGQSVGGPRSRTAHPPLWAELDQRWTELWFHCTSTGGHKGEREARRKGETAWGPWRQRGQGLQTVSWLLRGQGRLSATLGRSQGWPRGSRQGAMERVGLSECPVCPAQRCLWFHMVCPRPCRRHGKVAGPGRAAV